MNLQSSDLLALFCVGLIVLLRVRRFPMLWNRPKAHGTGFFFTTEVPPGFYEGPGAKWLKRYHGTVVAEHSTEALGLAAVLWLHHWEWAPLCAGACALGSVLTFSGFAVVARRSLRRCAPATTKVAIPLEARRMSQYISWPAEALAGAIVAASWLLLLTHGDAQVQWKIPIVLSYIMPGLLAAKVGVVRAGFRLPAERIAEHHHWVDAHRRHALRILGGTGYFLATILAGYSLLHAWPPAKAQPWFRWLLVALALGVWLSQNVFQFRDEERLADMGRDLRPLASSYCALPRLAWFRDTSLWWTVAYLTGFFLLLGILK